MIPEAEPGGRPRKAASRELVNAILYFLRAGMAWRLAPHDLPPWRTVYHHLRRWQREGCGAGSTKPWWLRIASMSAASPRPQRPSWTARPSGPPIKGGRAGGACPRASRRLDPGNAGKKVWGRKRHILTDTDGRLLCANVHGADVQDGDGAKGVLKRSRARYPFVERAFADGGYAGRLVGWAKDKTHIALEIVRRNASTRRFEVLPRRWVVERTFAWIIKNRRFVRDYEQLTEVAETLIVIAASATLLRRWP